MGRRLESAVRSDGIKISYTYNADGLRTSKTIRNVKFNYYWNGDKLTAQTNGDNNIWYFRYDGDTPIGFEFNGKEYYYVTNLQGDVIAILDSSGNLAAEYEYDAWGNCTVEKDTNTIAYINPLRYRGYYYDSDTDMYYLQSRYYDARIGRFINADSAEMLTEDDKSVLENNIYAYCYNDPVSYEDKDGQKPKSKKVKKAKVVKRIPKSWRYDRSKALKYMMKWYNGRNPDFYQGTDGDCANFVSQCMNAAGMNMNSGWKCKKKGKFRAWFSRKIGRGWSFGFDYTKSWGLAESHYDHFIKSSIVNTKYTIYNKDQINNNVKNWKIRPGDIVYYFKKGDRKPHHVAIVSRIRGPKSPLEVAQHTDNYLDRDVRAQLDGKDNYKVVVVCVKDNIFNWNRI